MDADSTAEIRKGSKRCQYAFNARDGCPILRKLHLAKMTSPMLRYVLYKVMYVCIGIIVRYSKSSIDTRSRDASFSCRLYQGRIFGRRFNFFNNARRPSIRTLPLYRMASRVCFNGFRHGHAAMVPHK